MRTYLEPLGVSDHPVGPRVCECGRVVSYAVVIHQLSAENRLHSERLYLCTVCYQLWREIENPPMRATPMQAR